MKILLVDDDMDLCESLSIQLKQEGYIVDSCHDGKDSIYFLRQEIYDLIILDRMLPSLDGVSALKAIRTLGITTPVIMVTALNSIGDRVVGLDAGADDYLVKPFAMEELFARIRALMRRPVEWEEAKELSVGNTLLDTANLILKGPIKTCSLSKKEFQLLEIFFRQSQQTIGRTTLLSRAWGSDSPVEDGNLDNYIHFIRRRLRTVESNLTLITVRGIGYLLEISHA